VNPAAEYQCEESANSLLTQSHGGRKTSANIEISTLAKLKPRGAARRLATQAHQTESEEHDGVAESLSREKDCRRGNTMQDC